MTPVQWVLVSVGGFFVVWTLGCMAVGLGIVAWQEIRDFLARCSRSQRCEASAARNVKPAPFDPLTVLLQT